MAASKITEQQIRVFLTDLPEYNTLVDGVRFTAEQIEEACELTVDAYNTFNPPSPGKYTVETFPYKYVMLTGVVGLLLKGQSVGEAANEFMYSADGVQITDRNKSQAFQALGQQFWQEFKDTAQNIKMTQNLKQAFGITYSEYIWRAR